MSREITEGYPANSTARQFYDIDGNPVSLSKLVRDEPEWARSRIIALEQESADKDLQIADLQRLCGRAHSVLSENFDAYRGKDGYGPSNLEADLKKAADGKEHRELQTLKDELGRVLKETLAERDNLAASLNEVLSLTNVTTKQVSPDVATGILNHARSLVQRYRSNG